MKNPRLFFSFGGRKGFQKSLLGFFISVEWRDFQKTTNLNKIIPDRCVLEFPKLKILSFYSSNSIIEEILILDY